jgi:DNA-binding NarL/FixJ family response regulator
LSRIRVFIVDDHYVLRVGLRDMLQTEPDVEVVGTAASANEALEALSKPLEIDILLTDLRMPDRTGDELVNELHKTREDLRVIFLSAYHSDEDVLNAVKAGGMGYLLKTATMEQILQAIRQVHSGSTYFPPNISKQLAQRLTRDELTVRELEVLRWAAHGLRNREIGLKLFISENTVRNHMVNLMAKLGTTHRTEAIAIGIQRGLVRLRDEESV